MNKGKARHLLNIKRKYYYLHLVQTKKKLVVAIYTQIAAAYIFHRSLRVYHSILIFMSKFTSEAVWSFSVSECL